MRNLWRHSVAMLRNPRLVALHHALVDLLDFLDPSFVRFPQRNRTKLEV